MDISLYFCFVIVVLFVGCIIVLICANLRLKNRFDALSDSLYNLEKLNSELRAQRHDYLNHLQVVYAMTELGEYEELCRYLEPVYKDIMKTGKALRTSIPAVNALLMAKIGEAEADGIDVYVEVKSDLKGLSIEAWELCKVLSNLIDNAMAALREDAGKEKKIILDITEDRNYYIFAVADNGPAIDEETQKKIFRKGFTTKGSGHGMGLFIVGNVLKENRGDIKVVSDIYETVFTVRFRK